MYDLGLVLSQQLHSPCLQKKHLPQPIGNGTITRSPTFTLLVSTSGPTSSTMPIGSCPRTSPGFMNGTKPSTKCKSEPQIHVDVTRTIASRLLMIFGSGIFSTFTLYGAHHTNAFIIVLNWYLLLGSHRLVFFIPTDTFPAPCRCRGADRRW